MSMNKPVVYKMSLNITFQYMQIRFSNSLKLSSLVFEFEIDTILNEINVYIP